MCEQPDQEAEESKETEAFASIKYIGFDIPPDGDWSLFLEHLWQKAARALSEKFDFLSNQFISPRTRIQIGRSRVLSKAKYGNDIVPLNKWAERNFTSLHRKMLRIVFGVPRATGCTALLMLAGETPFCD